MEITGLLHDYGIENGNLVSFLNILFTMIIVGVIGWVAYMVFKKLLPLLIKKIAGESRAHWGQWLLDKRFFNLMGLLIMAVVFRSGLSSIEWEHMKLINKVLDVWIVISAGLLLTSLLSGINRVYEKIASVKDKPVKIITQVITVIIWCIVVLVIISRFTEEKLIVLLGGMTAFAAVLMLVFKDPILGFVAGIQLSSNNMVRLGDWIVMPNRNADGDVIEIGLTTVKVQNWDKTITTIPTYYLVSESFINWRGMEESGGRRIKRSINIDIRSIHYLSVDELEQLKASELLRSYIKNKIAEIETYNANRASGLDERRMTNVGTFREYIELWLENNPDINQSMTHMVRQLQPGPTGLPIEIYCFSAKQGWIDYENIQSDIFDHIYAVMPLFKLQPFQYSGAIAEKES